MGIKLREEATIWAVIPFMAMAFPYIKYGQRKNIG